MDNKRNFKNAGSVQLNLNNPKEKELFDKWKHYIKENNINTSMLFKSLMNEILAEQKQ